jgi:uncharacterized protein
MTIRPADPPPAPLRMEHRAQIEPLLRRFPQPISGYTFASLMAWNAVDQYEWAIRGDQTLFITCTDYDGSRQHMQPVGAFSAASEAAFLGGLAGLDRPARILDVSGRFLGEHAAFAAHFEVCSDRENANYICRAQDLALLRGGVYAKKRNHISKAERSFSWTAHPLTGESRSECLRILHDMATTWTPADESHENAPSLAEERLALEFTLSRFDELDQRGVLIRAEGRPVAFSIYEALDPTTAVVHFEKADRSFPGLCQLVSREVAKAILHHGYVFINYEEDMGMPGLRQAKLSYGPMELRPSYTLTFTG